MDSSKRNKIIYWVVTLLLMVPGAGGGVVELFTSGPESVALTLVALGYPLYIMKILGIAKVLGGVAILSGKSPRLKEWAYAGFTFDFLGATASHTLAGDSAHAIFPFGFFVVLMVSYALWYKTSATPILSSLHTK
ncbi:MAG: DoxX family protein [Bdellovibrio sp.]|nr:DoxX family protein [Bdellovibrio sp.]